ncbi:HDOD domain-containing protein [Vibrio coralliilyticus]|uniref:HDOD domain-containing protein n=1 Tax=Vibrio coralliilyticus TaxID=190893 RepID=UPI0018359A45|nr:HDOD domain-containing protein [Vibrio coralliilyticus]NUW67437.1 HDOD domain-containing protein [Vibrio coralliilyticus]
MIDIDEEKMASVVSSFQVPAKPKALSELQEIMKAPEPDINLVADLISSDIGLSSAILKVINSPYYGMSRTISEIKQAVMIIGLTTINSLVTSLLLKSALQGKASISLERFWDDSLDVANAMLFIGNRIKDKVPIDMLYTVGLFHNCGIPLLALRFDDYKDVLIEANNKGCNSIVLEEEKYNTNHAVLGYFIANSWHLPKEICEIILQHHNTHFFDTILGGEAQLTLATLKVAENFVERAKRHSVSPDWQDVELGVSEVLGLSTVDFEELEDDYDDLYTQANSDI